MTLIERNPASHLLDGMVTCQHCGAPMETAGESLNEAPQYVCTTKNKGCDTPDIDPEPFNRLVLRTVINAILDENGISKVTRIVEEKAFAECQEAIMAIRGMQAKQHRLFGLHEGKPLFDREIWDQPHGRRERIRAEDGSRIPRVVGTGRTVL